MSANDELQAHTCEKILQEYGNFANNVAQANSQDLTEKWKKGELGDGYYYMQLPNGDIRIITNSLITNCNGSSILAPVPSYEEWNQLRKFLEEFNALDVAKENQQLKDVISKMCMELVDPDDDMSNGLAEYFNQDLLLEIHEVLK